MPITPVFGWTYLDRNTDPLDYGAVSGEDILLQTEATVSSIYNRVTAAEADIAALTAAQAAAAPLFARKLVNESVSSATTGTTLQNDDALLVSVAASAVYEFRLRLIVNSGTAPDFKLGWTYPSGLTMTYDSIEPSASGVASALVSTPYVETTIPAFSTFNADQVITLSGLIVSITAGTLQLQWAQNTSDAGSTTVKAGSFLRLLKVA